MRKAGDRVEVAVFNVRLGRDEWLPGQIEKVTRRRFAGLVYNVALDDGITVWTEVAPACVRSLDGGAS